MASSSRRRLALVDDELEEGECAPYSSASDTDEDDSRYLLQSRGPEKRRRLEDIVAAGLDALPSPTPSCDSDKTLSDGGGTSPSSVAGPMRLYGCRVCGKEFGSPKAVDGHMRVHDRHRRHGQQQGRGKEIDRYVAVNGGWAATGKRGWTGDDKAVSSSAESNHSMSNLPLQPVPVALSVTDLSSESMASTTTNLNSGERSSAQPRHNEPMAIVVAGANPSTDPVVNQPAASSQPAAEQAQVAHQLAVPSPAAYQGQLVGQPAAPRREYSCKECGKSFPTHQGLGGHAAGHMNRRKEAEAAAAAAGILQDGSVIAAACRRGTKQAKTHGCRKCHQVFDKGVSLGGHMRKHYTGPPIVHRKNKKRCLAPPVVVVAPAPAPAAEDVANAALAQMIKTEVPPLAQKVEAAEPAPTPMPVVTGRVLLFGVDLARLVQAPSEQQGAGTTEGSPSKQQGSGTTEGSASAGGQQ